MATIQVFPLSISGIQAPLNLLNNILGSSQSPKNLFYPMDLSSNPVYAHAIQFTICDFDYTALENVQGGISAIKNVNSAVQSYINSPTPENLSSLTTTLSPAASAVNNTIVGLQSGGIKTTTLSTISLYMPDTLNTTIDTEYTELSLTSAFGAAGYLARSYAEGAISTNGPSKEVINQGVETLAGLLNPGLGALAGNVLKQVLNPQLQLIYRSTALREFQFEFTFTPTTSQEAATVDQIIKTFQYYSLPDIVGTGQYLTPPQIFKIQFSYTGSPGVLGQISNLLTNTLTNVFGTQLTSFMNPTSSISGNTNQSKLFDIGNCVLSNVMVDYAPNGFAAYEDGYPVQTTITLQFKEMNIRTKSDMRGTFNLGTPQSSSIPQNNQISSAISNSDNYAIDSSSQINNTGGIGSIGG